MDQLSLLEFMLTFFVLWKGAKIGTFCVWLIFPDAIELEGRGSSAVERATPGEEVPGSIPAVAARSLQVGSVSV